MSKDVIGEMILLIFVLPMWYYVGYAAGYVMNLSASGSIFDGHIPPAIGLFLVVVVVARLRRE